MKILSTYKVKIKTYNHIFRGTVEVYRHAVDFLIDVCLKEWVEIKKIDLSLSRQQYVERLCHFTKKHPETVYDFDKKFYKFPSFLRRAAINEAIGKVSSYKSNLKNWEEEDPNTRGRRPSFPRAGYIYPCMYRKNMYQRTGAYEAKIKVYIRNTWDWLTVKLRKSDMDYIERRCSGRRKCVPVLQKRGKEWHLDFPFEEFLELCDVDVADRIICAVDLGINAAATISVMRSDGTILGRHFLKLPKDHEISVKTAKFIMDIAALYNADVIVFEYLEKKGKKHGSRKQRLHLWKSQEVQRIVTDKAHRLGMHIARICAWNTSRLAYDGSGRVLRGRQAGFSSYSVCQFQNGKIYNCDLSASYNIGARYFIREILKSLPEKERLALEAEVPQAAKRSTCTWSTLIRLNAELVSSVA